MGAWEDGFAAGFTAGIKAASDPAQRRLDVGIDIQEPRLAPTRKRRVSKYNRVYSKHFKKLKAKHPRTAFLTLSKRAHRAAKKEMK
jgi:hypothetical protein